MDGQREESAAQRVALLDPRFAVNVDNLSIVKILETALATLMSLNVIPEDVTTHGLVRLQTLAWDVDKMASALLENQL